MLLLQNLDTRYDNERPLMIKQPSSARTRYVAFSGSDPSPELRYLDP